MERRTFLGTAAAAIGGLVSGRLPRTQSTKWTPPPRWEWEVGPWRTRAEYSLETIDGFEGFYVRRDMCREWTAGATVVGEEVEAFLGAQLACNRAEFITGVPIGQLCFTDATFRYIGSGLVDCDVRLRESLRRQDGMHLYNPRTKESQWMQHSRLVDFYDIFRGEHAVVSVNSQEPNVVWEIVSLECPE